MKSVGLALSGGAVRGAAHIGVIEVLQESGVPIDYIAGTSAGAFTGAFLAAGFSAAEMKVVARELKWGAISSVNLHGLGVLDAGNIEQFFRRHLGERNIEDLSIPFAAMAASLTSGRLVAIDRGPVFRAVQASSAIPGVFAPIEIDGETYVDGGTLNFDPVNQVRAMGADYVIAVKLVPPHGRKAPPRNVVDVVIVAFDLLTSRMAERGRRAAQVHIEQIRADLGLLSAKQAIRRHLRYAKSLLSGARGGGAAS